MSANEDVQHLELSHMASGSAKWYSHPGKQVSHFFYKVKPIFSI